MLVRSLLLIIAVIAYPAYGASIAPVFVTTLNTQEFVETIEALGTLKSNEAITLTATITDTVKAVHFADGQRVKANDVLVELTSDEEHAQLEEARYALEEAQKQYDRVKSLALNSLTTESVLDERRQAFQSAQSKLLAMQSRMADRLIVAPFAGVLGMRDISVGALVRPGDTITTLDDDSSMKLDMTIPAVYLSTLKIGMSVSARSRELGDKEFTGKITAIDSRIDPHTRSVLARARLDNPLGELRSGMLISVVLKKPAVPTLLLPEEALIREGFRSYVYRLQNTTPETVAKVEVQAGARNNGKVVIDTGLQDGDRIVTHGVMRLKHGTSVSVEQEHMDGVPLDLKPADQRGQ